MKAESPLCVFQPAAYLRSCFQSSGLLLLLELEGSKNIASDVFSCLWLAVMYYWQL